MVNRILILLILLFCYGCSQTNRIKFINDGNIVDSLSFDSLGKIYLKKIDDSLIRFEVILNNKQKFYNDKIIFPIGELTNYDVESMQTQYISMNYENNALTIIQEYGDDSPQGWYIQYISYHLKQNEFIIDSISHEWKNYKAKEEKEFIKKRTKNISSPLFRTDVISKLKEL